MYFVFIHIRVREFLRHRQQTAASSLNHEISFLMGVGLLLHKHRRNAVETQKRQACPIHLMQVNQRLKDGVIFIVYYNRILSWKHQTLRRSYSQTVSVHGYCHSKL